VAGPVALLGACLGVATRAPQNGLLGAGQAIVGVDPRSLMVLIPAEDTSGRAAKMQFKMLDASPRFSQALSRRQPCRPRGHNGPSGNRSSAGRQHLHLDRKARAAYLRRGGHYQDSYRL
jgi:hypothetical protein